MNPYAMDRSGKRKKRKQRGDEAAADDASTSSSTFDSRIFPILLAAASAAAQTTLQSGNSRSPAALVARLLRRVLSRTQRMRSPLPDSLVALLPLFLSSSSSSVAAVSCEMLGAAALRSREAGEVLASDGGIASGLAMALGGRSQRVTEAACNSILDLSASPVGREHLATSPVLPRILWNLFMDFSVAEALNAQKELQKETNSCV